MKKLHILNGFSGASLAALALASSPAGAQPAATPPAPAPAAEAQNDVADIVVTARRTEERLQDVPISITVYNQQQISNRNVVTAADLATFTPSLSTNTRFGAESSSFTIRGFTQEGATVPSVAVYFADVVAPRANGGTTAGNGAGVGSFFDLQNVQVLKGPQGTLFGRNTTGGAVLLVPQKPTSRLEGYVEGSIGNYDMRRIQAVANVPVTENLRVRLGVDHQKRDGFLHNISGIGPRDFGDVNYTAVRLSVVADLTPNIENYTIGSYSRSSTNGFYPKIFNQDNVSRDPVVRDASGNIVFNGPALRAAQIAATSGDYYDVSNGNPNPFQRIKQWSVINTTTWNATDTITVKNIASYAQFRQAQSANIYGENPFQTGAPNIGPYYAVNVVPAPGRNNVSQWTFTEELQLQGRSFEDRLNYQAGVYFERSRPLDGFQATYSPNGIICTDITGLQCVNLPGRTSGFVQRSATKYRFRNLGVYAQGTFKITDTISVTGGIRYTSDVTSGLGQVLKISFPSANTPSYGCAQPPQSVVGGASAEILADPSPCDFRRRVKSSKPTWLIDVDWKPNQDILVYAKYARGYRQGSVNVSSFGLETWEPEKVDLYEIGAKTSFRSFVRGTFNIAAFYNDFNNQQIQINTVSCLNVAGIPGFTTLFPACAGVPASAYPAPAAGIGNGGKSTIKGIEVDSSITPFTGLTVDVSYAHLDTKLKSITIPAIPFGFATLSPNAVVGGPLSLTPKNKYSITASYTLPLDESIGKITAAATFTHQDSSIGNTSSLPAARILPAQNLLNLNLNWNSIAGGPLDLALFATNVTKEKFFVYTTGSSFGWDAAVLNQPRMYGARLRFRFGQ